MGRLQGGNQIVVSPTLADLVQKCIIGSEIDAEFLHQHGHTGTGHVTSQQRKNLRACQRLLGCRTGTCATAETIASMTNRKILAMA